MTTTFLKRAFVLSLCGTVFAGYLSGTKLFTGDCAFNEPCPYFLGYPACWYGFALFLSMFVVSFLGMRGKYETKKATMALVWISLIGLVFSGSFVAREVYGWLTVGLSKGYGLVLPTCVYGLAFYAVIHLMSVLEMLSQKKAN